MSLSAQSPQPASDPKGLIREAYAITGITESECRSILIDWALSLPANADQTQAARELLAIYSPSAAPDHPMTHLLIQAQTPPAKSARRGGRAGRLGY
jgi:hypothetical protein